MAVNVFGTPITDDIVRGYPEFKDKDVITPKDRATVALKKHNDKYDDAVAFVKQQKHEYRDGVSALCLIYNATGDTVTYVTNHNWLGYYRRLPGSRTPSYPQEIPNGHWASFLYTHPFGEANGAEGGLVYRGKNEAGDSMDWMLSWSVPWGPWYKNKAYTMVREAGHFESEAEWKELYDLLRNSSKEDKSEFNGCVSSVKLGGGTSPFFNGLMTLK